ncbi:hypothetical protein JCM16814_04690 [Desulfobaculum senezii]|jgi:CRISPR-associated protein Cas2
MPRVHNYVVAYDISNDKERLRVSKVLEGFGERVQGSVFECVLDAAGKRRLCERLSALELATGFVSLYRLAPDASRDDIGDAPPKPSEAYSVVI